jgi:hypothetical protein
MQQRRVRLGDILDDYCPRERRITNHAVVAMIEDTVKQTRCTTCDADHEYRGAKVPAPRRRKPGAAEGVLVDARPRRVQASAADPEIEPVEESAEAPETQDQPPPPAPVAETVPEAEDAAALAAEPAAESDRDEWPVHRPLIRATLPRPEGQAPERKAPDFTFRPAGGRFDSHRNGQRKTSHRPTRHAHGQPQGTGRFGGPRAGSGQGSGSRHGAGQGQTQGHGQRHGNKQGPGGGNRPGQNRGPRQGGGGRKRGR